MNRAGTLVAVVAALSVTPGISEIAENVFHLVEHGDLAHLAEHDEDAEDAEHGCSGPYHFCVCHTSSLFLVADALVSTAAVDFGDRDLASLYRAPVTQAHPRGIFRPPIV